MALRINPLFPFGYKSSEKYGADSKLYRYTITSVRKNTRVDMNLQYHYNQGFGYFASSIAMVFSILN
ncbi:MAG: hypothetical protein Ct9H90mP7_2290 [Candidatus Neomarinimicrobiota bacterium]|nr:MAG: hypothetical protein Ct9H90mP7_2290 [Candidatus Neomarinimicrobiota bacterium]